MGCSGSGLTVVQLPSQPELHPSFLREHWAFDLPHSASHNQTCAYSWLFDPGCKSLIITAVLAGKRMRSAHRCIAN